MGVERLIDTNYNKWSKNGDFGYNHFYVTIDQNSIPRRLDEDGKHLTDYLVHTFVNKTFDESYFTLPNYCNETCPSTTICGKLRGQQNLLSYDWAIKHEIIADHCLWLNCNEIVSKVNNFNYLIIYCLKYKALEDIRYFYCKSMHWNSIRWVNNYINLKAMSKRKQFWSS